MANLLVNPPPVPSIAKSMENALNLKYLQTRQALAERELKDLDEQKKYEQAERSLKAFKAYIDTFEKTGNKALADQAYKTLAPDSEPPTETWPIGEKDYEYTFPSGLKIYGKPENVKVVVEELEEYPEILRNPEYIRNFIAFAADKGVGIKFGEIVPLFDKRTRKTYNLSKAEAMRLKGEHPEDFLTYDELVNAKKNALDYKKKLLEIQQLQAKLKDKKPGLSPLQKSRLKLLEEEAKGLLDIINNFYASWSPSNIAEGSAKQGQRAIIGESVVTPEQASRARKRLQKIYEEMEKVVGPPAASRAGTVQPPNAIASQATTPASTLTQPPQSRTAPEPTKGEDQLTKLIQIHKDLLAKGVDPMSLPKVRAATETFLRVYPQAKEQFENALVSPKVNAIRQQLQQEAPQQNLTVTEAAKEIGKRLKPEWSPERAGEVAAEYLSRLPEDKKIVDFDSFKKFFKNVRKADKWTEQYLRKCFGTYWRILNQAGNALLNIRIPGTAGLRSKEE